MMLTRCPGCTTTFRVTPEQVKARHGKVRCGRCQHVFDAIEHLVDALVVAPTVAAAEAPHAAPAATADAAPPTPAADPGVEAAPPPSFEAAPEPDPEPIPEALPSEPVASAIPAAASELIASLPPLDTPPAEPPVRTQLLDADTAPGDDILLQPSPLSTVYAKPAATHVGWPWTVAATLVFVVLIAQLMLAFRVDLAVKYPQVRPILDMLCEHAGCRVELPSDPDMVSIEASDLHPAKKGGLELTATLRNRAPHAQAWPQLELTLTDGADKPIVRKVIAPEQYLPATQSADDGFAANGEQAVQLLLDAGTLPAAGYRLYLFYP
jgi:predicted Zn finger-like uncharacterized protein